MFDIVFVWSGSIAARSPRATSDPRTRQRRPTEEFRRSIGNSSLIIAISRLIVSGVSAGKPRMSPRSS